jgi:hypothetical protein
VSDERPAGPTAPEQPGRYQRSAAGLIGALLVSALVIGAYVGFRALTRGDLAVPPDRVDYRDAVSYAQQSGVEVVYPSLLPDGWFATAARLVPDRQVTWTVNLLTDHEEFVGIVQRGGRLADLLHAHVDAKPDEGPAVAATTPVAGRWRSFTDSGGDTALAARSGREWVLVYGTAPRADLRAVVDSLVVDPVAR